jgi:predicted dehydrogenase
MQVRGSTEQEPVELEPLDTIADQLGEFAAAIRGQGAVETDGIEARRTVAVLEAIVESAAANRWVDVVYPG